MKINGSRSDGYDSCQFNEGDTPQVVQKNKIHVTDKKKRGEGVVIAHIITLISFSYFIIIVIVI